MRAATVVAAWSVLWLALRNNHVDASAVLVNHFEPSSSPHNVISRLWRFIHLRDDETGHGH